MEGSFSLYSQLEVTNKELVIDYKPGTSIVKYNYKVYKDNKVIKDMSITTNRVSQINLIESGSYKIEVSATDKNGKIIKQTSGIYNIDKDKPIMTVSGNIFKMEALKKGETLKMEDLRDYLRVFDKQDGDLFLKTTCNLDSIDYSKVGLYDLKCSVIDKASNITTNTYKFNIVRSSKSSINILQVGVIFALILSIIFILKYIKAINLEKKIVKYSVEPIKNRKISTIQKLKTIFKNIIHKLSNGLKKSVVISNHAKKYDKYSPLYHDLYDESIEFISFKIVVGVIFVIITLISKTIQLKMTNFYEMILPFIFGYYFPNIIYIIKYKMYRSKIENDLLQAIIIMNNAFKSGRSIIQAIELVTKELTGPISEEYKKMYLEYNLGLSIETVFKRFEQRIKLEDVTYLTASLSILNKTGGNIIKVFSSIEKSLFNKKKLKLEMRSLTGASKLIAWILFLVPFLFVILISAISPTYFVPLYTNPLGIILIVIMLIIYLIYIWIIRKIMKVRM